MKVDPKYAHLPQPGDSVRFKEDLIATFPGRPDETWASMGEIGKIFGTERPGNLELFWVETSRKKGFLANMNQFEVVPAQQ